MWLAYGIHSLKNSLFRHLIVKVDYTAKPGRSRKIPIDMLNAFYNLTPDCSIGLEYLYGRRSNMNREDGQANRINAMIQYNF